MCRILGIVAHDVASFQFCLRQAPRSLESLSREHPDGWGVAVYDDPRGWDVGKQPLSAFSDPRFMTVAGESRGRVLVAHIRRRTVGPVSLENTHPFQSGRWVFAHNGTIDDVEPLRAMASPERLAQVRGSTDSELFFACILTALDRIGATGDGGSRGRPAADVEGAVARAVTAIVSRPGAGACNFLLTDGDELYAFRLGRTLHLLEREAEGDSGASILVASEALTDEAWTSVDEGTLLRISRWPRPTVAVIAQVPA